MEPHNKDISEIKARLSEIYVALMGSDISKDGGIVKRLQANEIKIETFETLIDKAERKIIRVALYVKILWGAAGAVAMAMFALIIKK